MSPSYLASDRPESGARRYLARFFGFLFGALPCGFGGVLSILRSTSSGLGFGLDFSSGIGGSLGRGSAERKRTDAEASDEEITTEMISAGLSELALVCESPSQVVSQISSFELAAVYRAMIAAKPDQHCF